MFSCLWLPLFLVRVMSGLRSESYLFCVFIDWNHFDCRCARNSFFVLCWVVSSTCFPILHNFVFSIDLKALWQHEICVMMSASVGRSGEYHPSRVNCLQPPFVELNIFFALKGLTRIFTRSGRWSNPIDASSWLKSEGTFHANFHFLMHSQGKISLYFFVFY